MKSKKFFKNAISLFFVMFLLTFLSNPSIADEQEPAEIEIETTVTAEPIEKFMVTGSVIDREEIEKTPVRDLSGLLRQIPGVTSLGIGNKKGKAEIAIRGFGMNYVRVFLDGIPLNTANDRTVDFTLIPVEIIEKIEVIKGPAPVTYTSDSMGGIINIITRSGRDAPGFSLAVAGGNFGSVQTTGVASGGSKNTGFFATAKFEKTDGYRPHTAEDFTHLFLKADHDLSDLDNLSFIALHTNGDREASNGVNPDGTLRPQQIGFWSGSYNWEYLGIKQQAYQLKIERNKPRKFGYRFNVYYKAYDDTLRAYVDQDTSTAPPQGSPFAYYGSGRWNYSYWHSYIYGGDLQVYVPVYSHRLTLGASLEKPFFQDTKLGRNTPFDTPGSLSLPMDQWDQDYLNPWRNVQYSSFYVQDEMKLNPDYTLTLGLRNDSFSETGSTINGIVNLVYRKGENTVRATVGKTGRFPTLKELEGKAGNPDLLPEHAYNYEISYRNVQPKLIDAEVAVYYSTINNLIQPEDPTESFSINKNISRVSILGAETNLIRKWKNLEARVGYSYIHRVSPPLTPDWEEVPMHKGVVDFRWEKQNSLCWAVQGIFVGSKKTGDPDIEKIPGYGIVNVMLAYPSFSRNADSNSPWNLELKVTNLFDQEYQNRLYFPAPGRWIIGQINYRF